MVGIKLALCRMWDLPGLIMAEQAVPMRLPTRLEHTI